jgi:hypothetical protein
MVRRKDDSLNTIGVHVKELVPTTSDPVSLIHRQPRTVPPDSTTLPDTRLPTCMSVDRVYIGVSVLGVTNSPDSPLVLVTTYMPFSFPSD